MFTKITVQIKTLEMPWNSNVTDFTCILVVAHLAHALSFLDMSDIVYRHPIEEI